MPTILRFGRFRFFFFSNESQEPPHVHVKAAEHEAKFWLEPISLAANYGFKQKDLTTIKDIIEDYREDLLEHWHEYFEKEAE